MAGGKVLGTNVHVERDGVAVVLEPGTKLPGWAKELVTNPKAFAPEVEDEPVDPAPTEPVDPDAPKPYSDWKNDELAAELKKRELPSTGNKDDLVARLEESDEEDADLVDD